MTDNAFASLAPLEPLMDKCVHCGFCLPACPSYLLLGRETDSPRGRIYAMRAGMEGRTAMTPTVVEHFDTCLGCMACETACPEVFHVTEDTCHIRADVRADATEDTNLENKAGLTTTTRISQDMLVYGERRQSARLWSIQPS